jgi:hypothetical protein
MENRNILIAFRILLIVLGIGAFFFQLPNLIFGTMVKSASYSHTECYFYLMELVPHLFTIIIIVWFVAYQIRKIRKS